MRLTDISSGKLAAAVFKLSERLGDDGEAFVDRINSDPNFANLLAGFVRGNNFEPSASQQRAREIMGKNFFGVEEAVRHLWVNPTTKHVAALAEIPFSEETLNACKDTHILVAVFPLSILDIRGHARKRFDRILFYSQDWYNKQVFAKDKGEVGWQLVRKEPIANSTSKTWDEQQALLPKTEETPTARVVVYTMIGHFLATGERLFEKVYVRCVDLDSDGHRVHLGYFDAGGLRVFASGTTSTAMISSACRLPGNGDS